MNGVPPCGELHFGGERPAIPTFQSEPGEDGSRNGLFESVGASDTRCPSASGA